MSFPATGSPTCQALAPKTLLSYTWLYHPTYLLFTSSESLAHLCMTGCTPILLKFPPISSLSPHPLFHYTLAPYNPNQNLNLNLS